MHSLAKILQNKDIIMSYCKVFNYDNPRILYLAGEDCFNLVVDDMNAVASGDALLENLLSDKLECTVNVMISDGFTNAYKDEAPKYMATLTDIPKIEGIFKKPYSEIMIADRNSDEITLARYERLKGQIIEAFKIKGLPSPYAVILSKETPPTAKQSTQKALKREHEKTNATLFKDKKAVEPDEEKDHRLINKRAKKVEETDVITKPSQFSRPTKS